MPFHLRFTPHPKGLDAIQDYDISGALARATRYIVAHETKDKKGQPTVPHYHVWVDTDVCEKTLRNHVTKALSVPTNIRGKTNGYYSVQEWSDPDYICKWGDIRSAKGYSPAEISQYIKNGEEKFLRITNEVHVVPAAEGRAKRSDDNLLDLYQVYLDEVIPKDLAHIGQTYTIGHLRSKSIAWWRKRSGGLLPQTSTYKRFLASAWLEVNEILRKSQCIAEVELEKYGY